ncbi:hypothetical protein HMY34_14730 [Thiothrix subterranea]|uniref:hypothetical protein n=1 Tax=Thiothrix subterranea TaxID=2735563 RepID=UPI00192AD755|nr:hypothetical protein [Thiothrix subterranea]QQZ29913.1 hypothetical protein HMY34_14730 [Thiothrix subterranea]
MKPKFFTILLTTIVVMATSQANALTFQKTGKITRILSDSSKFGGCMVQLDVSIGNTCPTTPWVSLDCKAVTTPAGDGNRHYASALLAASLNKQVTIYIDNTKKINAYCVGTRIDTIF